MKVLLAISAVLALFVGWRKWEDVRAIRPINAIASEIAQRPVEVRCPGFFARLVDIHGESGSVQFDANGRPNDSTVLRDWVCDDLKHFRERDLACVDGAFRCDAKAERTITSVLTLAHESFHLKGVRDEATAQCYAEQTTAMTALRLGAPPARADAIARYFAKWLEPRFPTEYQLPPGCEDGGPLDLQPARAGWPNPPS